MGLAIIVTTREVSFESVRSTRRWSPSRFYFAEVIVNRNLLREFKLILGLFEDVELFVSSYVSNVVSFVAQNFLAMKGSEFCMCENEAVLTCLGRPVAR